LLLFRTTLVTLLDYFIPGSLWKMTSLHCSCVCQMPFIPITIVRCVHSWRHCKPVAIRNAYTSVFRM